MASSGSNFLDWAGELYLGKLAAENPTPQVTQAAPQPDNANAYVDASSSPAAYAGADARQVNAGQTAVAKNTVSVGGIVMDKRVLQFTGVLLAGMAVVKLAKG
ncbi:hypothetical protein [uncultured Microbulbifer sp.]|uniref:hypothetical protein n=1 Tax=uncultured Microbulbifer sp. TaxID=348147 RepID=UPI0026012E36|nr:hypothetical protein [uncultured Microbulbifer sp.]